MTNLTPLAQPACIAFLGERQIAEGGLRDVARALKTATDVSAGEPVLVFNLATSEPVEIDLRGGLEEILARLPAQAEQPQAPDAQSVEEPRRGPGRPRLGVVAREVTLLPRHWDWLASQSGGASVAIRRLVEEARTRQAAKDRVRKAGEATYRFATVMAGNRPHYEEAMRALFASDRDAFHEMTQSWPRSIRDHARRLAAPAFDGAPDTSAS